MKLQLKALRRSAAADIEKALDHLPATLHETYQRILQDFSSNPTIIERVRHVLESIAFSKVDLSPEQVAEIYRIRFGPEDNLVVDESQDCSHGTTTTVAFLLKACPGIIEITARPAMWFDSNPRPEKVQFIHFSAKEYLLSSHLESLGNPISSYGFNALSAHATLTAISLCALEPGHFESLPGLRAYANTNWYKHVSPEFGLKELEPLLSRFLDPVSSAFQSWVEFSTKVDLEGLLPRTNEPNWWRPPKASSLHWATLLGLDIHIKRLVQNGMDINTPDADGDTPLHWAVHGRHKKLIRLLYEYGAALEASDHNGNTPLHRAATIDCADTLSACLKSGAFINAINSQSNTPLHVCCAFGHTEMARLLFDHGASPDVVNNNGQTPLHICCEYEHTELARLLLDREARVKAPDSSGLNPLQVVGAAFHHQQSLGNQTEEIIKLLLEYGASPELGEPQMVETRDGELIQPESRCLDEKEEEKEGEGRKRALSSDSLMITFVPVKRVRV